MFILKIFPKNTFYGRILFVLLTYISQSVYAQKVVFKNESSGYKFETLSNTIFNKVCVMVDNTPCSDINLKGENLVVKKDDSCTFYLKVVDPYKRYSVTIYNNKDSITTQHFSYINNDIGLPTLSLGCGVNEYGSLLCSEADSVFCKPTLPDVYNQKIHFSVVSFLMTFIRDGDEILLKEFIVGNRISKKAKGFIRNLNQHDRMVLTKVIIKDDNENYYTIETKEFTAF